MDIATIAGITTSLSLVGFGIYSGLGGFRAVIDPAALAIVCGGTAGALLLHFSLGDAFQAFGAAWRAFFSRGLEASQLVDFLTRLSRKARREGLLALEADLAEAGDAFLRQGLQLTIDGQDARAIEAILTTEIEALAQRHGNRVDFFVAAGAVAPAFGVVGTVVGLIQMLMSLEQPDAVGPAIALALLTTMYGVLLSNLLFRPIAGKLYRQGQEETRVRQLVLAGLLAIRAGDPPRLLEQKVGAFLGLASVAVEES